VFQKPNPFPKSIYDNVAFGPRITGRRKGEVSKRVTAEMKAESRRGRHGKGRR